MASRKRLRRRAVGYTLSETMLVVAILGILILVAFPRWGEMVRKSRERRTLSHLGVIRSSLLLYYNSNRSTWPSDLRVLTINNRYLQSMNEGFPPAEVANFHAESAAVQNTCSPEDSGKWGFNTSLSYGVFVCCSHTDTKGSLWDAY